MNYKIIEWQNNRLRVLDQRLLPRETTYREFTDYHQVIDAIQALVIRGAPLIGLAGACGLALAAQQQTETNAEGFVDALYTAAEELRACRPTAIHLVWAIDRMLPSIEECAPKNGAERVKFLVAATNKLRDEQLAIDQAIGKAGAGLLASGDYILTHCNAGALATGGEGTALAAVKTAIAAGRRISMVICETRPMFQGARLTAWECEEAFIPYTLITDSMAAHFMKVGRINAVLVGADRIAANGDFANKIGTYALATLAKAHKIPFYVAAPCATVDLDAKTGMDIPIEEREGEEITLVMGRAMIAPERARVWNPAFDVTPASLVTAYVTERGIIAPKGVRHLFATDAKLKPHKLSPVDLRKKGQAQATPFNREAAATIQLIRRTAAEAAAKAGHLTPAKKAAQVAAGEAMERVLDRRRQKALKRLGAQEGEETKAAAAPSEAEAKKAAPKKGAEKPTPAKKKGAAPKKKAVAKKAPAKPATAKKAPVKKAPVKKAPVKKAPAAKKSAKKGKK